MAHAFRIVPAILADASAMAEIYAHHVRYGTASFELDPPDEAEIAARMDKGLGQGWPWLAARGTDGGVLGYAYAAQLHPRPGYRFACEDSIYIRHDALGQGIGTALLAALIDAATASGFRQMLALIAGTEPASIALHARAGFARCGLQRSVGWKHGRWIDVIHMQRALGAGDTSAPVRSR